MVKKTQHKNPGNQNTLSEVARKTTNALDYVQAYQRGDVYTLSSQIYQEAQDWLRKYLPDGMPQRRRQRVVKKRRPKRRRRNNFMGVTRIPCRRVIIYDSSSGTKHRWYYNVKLSIFMKTFADEYQDFRMISLRVRYLPNNATNETGLYAAVLLDSTGFGSWGSATATSWFPTIGAMPGARIRPRYVPTTFMWRPTEPSAREWHTRSEDVTYCTVYICNNGKETDELGGLLEISGTMLARGLYYNATVKKLLSASLDQPDISMSPLCVEEIEKDSSPPPNIPSRSSSRAMSYGGFTTLG